MRSFLFRWAGAVLLPMLLVSCDGDPLPAAPDDDRSGGYAGTLRGVGARGGSRRRQGDLSQTDCALISGSPTARQFR
jgi:hypothetical protein